MRGSFHKPNLSLLGAGRIGHPPQPMSPAPILLSVDKGDDMMKANGFGEHGERRSVRVTDIDVDGTLDISGGKMITIPIGDEDNDHSSCGVDVPMEDGEWIDHPNNDLCSYCKGKIEVFIVDMDGRNLATRERCRGQSDKPTPLGCYVRDLENQYIIDVPEEDLDPSDAAEKDSILLSEIFHSDLFPLVRMICCEGDWPKAAKTIYEMMDTQGYFITAEEVDKAVLTISVLRASRDGVQSV